MTKNTISGTMKGWELPHEMRFFVQLSENITDMMNESHVTAFCFGVQAARMEGKLPEIMQGVKEGRITMVNTIAEIMLASSANHNQACEIHECCKEFEKKMAELYFKTFSRT